MRCISQYHEKGMCEVDEGAGVQRYMLREQLYYLYNVSVRLTRIVE